MNLKRTGSRWDRNQRININDNWDVIEQWLNQLAERAQDLVAEGQLTEEQYAELITVVNGLIKSGHVDKSDLTPEFKDEIEGFSAQLAQKATKTELSIERKRISNFTALEEGSTTGDAELIDGRIGADDYVYDSIGDSLRRQFQKTGYEMDNKKHEIDSLIPPSKKIKNMIENGDFLNGSGLLANKWESDFTVQRNIDYFSSEKMQKIDYEFIDRHLDQQIPIKGLNYYYIRFKVKKVIDVESKLTVGFSETKTSLIRNYKEISTDEYNPNSFTTISMVIRANDDIYNYISFSGAGGVRSNAYLKDVLVVDLTNDYGKGNEPTVEEFDSVINKIPNGWFDGYQSKEPIGEIIERLMNGTGSGATVFELKKNPTQTLNFEAVGNDIYALATSYDGKLYGISSANSAMLMSDDGGNTWNAGVNPQVGQVSFAVVFSDGSVAAYGIDGKFSHSESYNKPFTLKKDVGGLFSGLNFSTYDNGLKKYVIASEYGRPDSTAMVEKKLWMTRDGGLNYTLLKKGDVLNDGNNHWHTAMFDQYSGGIWASQGDGTNARLYYTADFGVTWTYFDGLQPTSIHAFPRRIVFGRDEDQGVIPGADEWIRDEPYPTKLKEAFTFREDKYSYHFYPDNSRWNNSDPNEYYLLFPNRLEDEYAYIYGTADGGASWHKIFETNTLKPRHLTGVDNQGYVYFLSSGTLYRAKRIGWEVSNL